MKKSFIIVVILLFLLIGFFIGVYYYYEKPKQIINEMHYSNLSLCAKENDKLIKIGYKVFSNNNLIEEGETLELGAKLISIPIPSNIRIVTQQKNGYIFYPVDISFFYNSTDIKRIELDLKKIDEMFIYKNGSLGIDNPINVTLNIDNNFSNFGLCLFWSDNIIYADVKNNALNLIDKIEGYDKCYEFNYDNLNKLFQIDYKIFGNLREKDMIKLLFFYNFDEESYKDGYVYEIKPFA